MLTLAPYNHLLSDSAGLHDGAVRPDAFGYASLLQELLMALAGFTGDVFLETGTRLEDAVPDPDSCNISLSPDISWVDSPDRATLNNLVVLGYHYRAIQSFIDRETAAASSTMSSSSSTGGGTPALQGSLYRRALATGLTEALDVYTASLLELQQVVLGAGGGGSGQPPVLAAITHHLHDFKVLLPQLHCLVADIASSSSAGKHTGHGSSGAVGLSGAATSGAVPGQGVSGVKSSGRESGGPLKGREVLAVLSEAARGGQPAWSSCAQRLLWHVHQVLLRQISSWMVHGMLLDPFNEFFITGPPAASNASGSAAVALAAGMGAAAFDWQTSYQVVQDRLPPWLDASMAEDILFVGKAVLLLRTAPPPSKTGSAGAGGVGLGGAGSAAPALPLADSLEFARALATLQSAPTLDRAALGRVVGALRARAAALLWHLVVAQADLQSHLAALKSYFLLARGELFHSLLAEATRSLLSLPPRPHTADTDVGAAFASAALSSTAQHDPLLPRFRLRWAPMAGAGTTSGGPGAAGDGGGSSTGSGAQRPPPAAAASVPQYDPPWDGIWMEYSPGWPLALVLTPAVLGRYNALFQYLLRLKRVQLRLEGAWQMLCEMEGSSRRSSGAARTGASRGSSAGGGQQQWGGHRDPVVSELLRLRHHMAHLVTNLQIYLQVDVIESNYSILEEKLNAAQDFSEAERAHASYLHTLMAQSFLTTHTMSDIVSSLFRYVQQLCSLVESLHSAASTAALTQELSSSGTSTSTPAVSFAPSKERVATIAKGFQQVVTELYALLRSTRLLDINKAPHLRQLYLRLNFNGFMGTRMVTSTLTSSSLAPSTSSMPFGTSAASGGGTSGAGGMAPGTYSGQGYQHYASSGSSTGPGAGQFSGRVGGAAGSAPAGLQAGQPPRPTSALAALQNLQLQQQQQPAGSQAGAGGAGGLMPRPASALAALQAMGIPPSRPQQ